MLVVVCSPSAALVCAHSTAASSTFWAEWNYSGYEDTSRVEHRSPSRTASTATSWTRWAACPPGRAMWEGGQAIDTYGTSLALMLLPYWTDGRIASMEGLYYESAATTPFHFMAVAPLSGPGNASNPVRGLDYRTIEDFDLGVRYLQLLGVRYYMAYSHGGEGRTRTTNPDLAPRREVAGPRRRRADRAGRSTRCAAPRRSRRCRTSRSSSTPHAGTQSECFGREPTAGASTTRSSGRGSASPRAGGTTRRRSTGRSPPGGPDELGAGARRSDARRPRPGSRLPDGEVTDVHETDDSVSFHVSRTGVPVVVRTSYFPNWEVDGADGPWRLDARTSWSWCRRRRS